MEPIKGLNSTLTFLLTASVTVLMVCCGVRQIKEVHSTPYEFSVQKIKVIARAYRSNSDHILLSKDFQQYGFEVGDYICIETELDDKFRPIRKWFKIEKFINREKQVTIPCDKECEDFNTREYEAIL